MLVGDIDEDIKHCPNKRCNKGRFKVTIWAPNRRYCLCGAKLKKGPGRIDDDAPPLIDDNDDTGARRHISRQQSELFKTSGGGKRNMAPNDHYDPSKVVQLGPAPVEKEPPKEPIDWIPFRGTREQYDEYVAEFKSGKFVKYDAWGNKTNVSDTFTCAESNFTGCPVLKAKESTFPRYMVRVPWVMYQHWVYLCRAFKTEWIAYLKGTKAEDGVYTITEMYFPKQKATGAHVSVIDDTNQTQEGTIGAIHSHVDMSAFFSEEDKRHANHPVEIVCNRRGELATSIQMPLECGRMSRMDTKCIFTAFKEVSDLADQLEGQLEEEKTYTYGGAGRAN